MAVLGARVTNLGMHFEHEFAAEFLEHRLQLLITALRDDQCFGCRDCHDVCRPSATGDAPVADVFTVTPTLPAVEEQVRCQPLTRTFARVSK